MFVKIETGGNSMQRKSFFPRPMTLALVLAVGLLVWPAVEVLATTQQKTEVPGVKMFPPPTGPDFTKVLPDKLRRKRDPSEKKIKKKGRKQKRVSVRKQAQAAGPVHHPKYRIVYPTNCAFKTAKVKQ